ncbi:ABC transporter permease [Comamonas sp. Y33R10-2]|uniref:MlaE family ABC transporter permease n=1 Tax=Comamonas sp. Y33R10-2 TaxID=2853257 RepID=UPI001C5C9735|nr:ABC transporter permease [Comamonas sp. Y33R10-2]QXZ08407.1 ABC transporter permease [Comamonas sp. Y33R10-2]
MSWSETTIKLPGRLGAALGAALAAQALAWWRSIYLTAILLVLIASPSSYQKRGRAMLAQQIYAQTAPVLLGFTALAALLCAVIARIVIVTAQSYGLSRYAQDLVVRVMVIELIPLTAALFVAMRCTIPAGVQVVQMRTQGLLGQWAARGIDPIRAALVPRAAAGVFAAITLAALSCIVALVTVYLSVYGFSVAGFATYTRIFGQIFTPSLTLVFVLKTWFFSLTVAVMPLASAMYTPIALHQRGGSELGGFARMFAVLLLIEVISLMGNYY